MYHFCIEASDLKVFLAYVNIFKHQSL